MKIFSNLLPRLEALGKYKSGPKASEGDFTQN